MRCEDLGSQRCLLADFVGLVTDGTWKCSSAPQTGWATVGFDDSSWPTASVVGPNGMSPWGFVTKISSVAKWIWNSDGTSTNSYCRIDISI